MKAGLCGLLLRVRRYAMLPEERVLEEGEAPPAGDAGREAKNARGERPQAQFAHRLPEEIEMVPPAPRGQHVGGGLRAEIRESTSAASCGCDQLRVDVKGRSYELD